MKGEFLLEIGMEEIPASFVPRALTTLEEQTVKALEQARIQHGAAYTYATPRRLILRIDGMAESQPSVEIEKTGPPTSSAYDADGNPTKTAIGFAKSQGVDVSELVVVKTPKGEQVAVRKLEEGRPVIEVLSGLLPGIMERISFPKTMRWMDLDARFARPIHWLLALYGGKVIPFSFGSIDSDNKSRGHRFTHPKPFKVSSFKSFEDGLSKRGVIIDQNERRETIMKEVRQLASTAGYIVYDDKELLDEVTFLVESPYPIMGEFPQEFVDLPASILITCMKKHQRYFAVQDDDGRITNRFIALNNTPVKDPEVSIQGHQRVLKARLEDARFYFREDRKKPLIERLEALKGVVFHSKLGTSYEKVQRFTRLACRLADQFIPDQIGDVERAALLCKCDLETGIVYEFPELQGIIGGFYADMDGENPEVASAIREHYLPAHAGDDLPSGMIGSLVSIADRIDTIVGCFCVGLIPTGATDPYALRRHALGVIQILMELGRPVDLNALVRDAMELVGDKRTRDDDEVVIDVMEFVRTRFVNLHTSRGFPLDVVEAAVRARFTDVVEVRRRVEALNQWKQRDDFDAIMTGFKRVVNILKNAAPPEMDEALLEEPSEKNLAKAFDDIRDKALPLIHRGEYEAALEHMAELKGPIDKFFDDVMVMVKDERVRDNRLALLKAIANFFSRIADFSFVGSTA